MPADFRAAYLDLGINELERRAEAAREELRACRACPRDCGVDRTAEAGACRVGRYAVVSSAFPHHGEEDCLRGSRGSGTIFFAGCNLRCVFCQNWDISQEARGREAAAEELAGMMLALQEMGCHNVNWVTPEHVVPQLLEAMPLAVRGGLRLPIVYNTSGYDAPRSLAWMDGIVDVYMPDFKFWDPEPAARYLKARDYPDAARAAIREMHRQVGDLVLGPDGLARRGLLVRHLVMPGGVAGTREVLRWLATELSPETYVNLMAQYRPCHRAARHPEIDRPPTAAELIGAFQAAGEEGITRLDGRPPRSRG